MLSLNLFGKFAGKEVAQYARYPNVSVISYDPYRDMTARKKEQLGVMHYLVWKVRIRKTFTFEWRQCVGNIVFVTGDEVSEGSMIRRTARLHFTRLTQALLHRRQRRDWHLQADNETSSDGTSVFGDGIYSSRCKRCPIPHWLTLIF